MRCFAPSRSGRRGDTACRGELDALNGRAARPQTQPAQRFGHDFAQVSVFPSATRGYAIDPNAPEEELHEAEPGAFVGQATDDVAPTVETPPAAPAAEAAPAPPPAPAPAPAPAPTCTITSATTLGAPDGTADTRTTVGIHEEVEFTTSPAAAWSASGGTAAPAAASTSFVWTAPDAAAGVTITATSGTPPTSCSLTVTVVEPSSLTFAKQTEDTFPAGTQGAGMQQNVDAGPLSVSFANVQWLEVPGPATNVRGYWKEKQDKGADMSHHPNPSWITLNNQNRASDHASSFGWPKPWKDGGFDWSIPNKFRVVGSTGAGKQFVTTLQKFDIVADGTTTVGKETESVKRTP